MEGGNRAVQLREYRQARAVRFGKSGFADELATSRRYEIVSQAALDAAAAKLGLRPPFDDADWLRIARGAGADLLVTGSTAYIRTQSKRDETTTEIGLLVEVTDLATDDLVNGSAALGTYSTSSREPPGITAALRAGRRAANDVAFYIPLEGMIMNTVGDFRKTPVIMNLGARKGVTKGMQLDVVRANKRIGQVEAVTVFSDDTELRILNGGDAIRPEDAVRAVFTMPKPKWAEGAQPE